jgi:DNA-binding SARP family transcriptional activator
MPAAVSLKGGQNGPGGGADLLSWGKGKADPLSAGRCIPRIRGPLRLKAWLFTQLIQEDGQAWTLFGESGMNTSDGAASGWTVRLLGGFSVEGPQGIVHVPLPGQRVAVYLIVRGHPVHRHHVAAAVWPDAQGVHARVNLRSTLCRLGSVAPIVTSSASSLRIADGVQIDVEDLQAAALDVREGRANGSVPWFDLELLPGWTEEWVEVERERVRQLELHLLDHVVDSKLDAGRPGDAIDAALRAIRLDPLREPSHAALLRALLADGDRLAAINHYRRLAARLRRSYGLAPSAEITSLMDEVLDGRPRSLLDGTSVAKASLRRPLVPSRDRDEVRQTARRRSSQTVSQRRSSS